MSDLPSTRDLFYPSAERWVPHGDDDALLIGRDLEADILVLQSGEVIARLDDRTWFINSSRDQYSRCLREVGAARNDLAAHGSDGDALVSELEERLQAIDAAAYSRDDSYWAIVVEQIRLEQF